MSQHIDNAVTAARIAAGNPADRSAFARLIAWRTLVDARGGIFHSKNLPAVTHVKSAPVPSTLQQCLDMHSPAVLKRIHAHAAKIGIRIPGNPGGDAA